MNDDFEIVADEAQEARIVAVILGEASAFEGEEVARLCAENPELQIFRRRMEAVHGLLGDSANPAPAPAPNSGATSWKLSGKKREEILSRLGEKERVAPVPRRKPALSRETTRTLIQIAACAAVAALLIGLAIPTQMKSRMLGQALPEGLIAESPSIVTYHAGLDRQEELQPSAVRADAPSAPSTSMARVIASNTASPTAIPVPKPATRTSQRNFGDGDDFGEGWGNGKDRAMERELAVSQLEEVNSAHAFDFSVDSFSAMDASPKDAGGGGVSAFGFAAADATEPAQPLKVDRMADSSPNPFAASGNYLDKASSDFQAVEPKSGSGLAWLKTAVTDELSPAELLAEVDKAWELEDPLAEKASPEENPALLRTGLIGHKLENIIIPQIDFEDTPLDEAIEYLSQKAQELDSDPNAITKGISFMVEADSPGAGDFFDGSLGGAGLLLGDDPTSKKIDILRLRNVPLGTALEYITIKTGLRYQIGENGITLLPIGSEASADLVTRTWTISPENYEKLMEAPKEDPFASEQEEISSGKEALENSGVSFPEGASARYLPESGVFVVRNSVSNLDVVDQILAEIQEVAEIRKETLAMDEKDAATEGDSTFSLHVSDVSFKLAKAALEQGKWPETVRVEEFVNAFSYRERALAPNERIGIAMEQAAHPFLSQRNLLRVSLQTAATGRGAGVPLRLTVVLDKSGSMERIDRTRAVEEAFRVLIEQLNPGDKVTLVGFSRQPTLLADFVDGSEGEKLLKILRETPSEGGTNVEEALRLAENKAMEHYLAGAQNRVILLTDGIANLGDAVPESLMTLVEEMREQGLAFDACGVGVEGVNDDILEALTRKGDGRYYLLGSTEESGADFAKQVAGALRPAAQNVKVQLEWNPDRVGQWRLYGFEKHELKKEDFRNDAVDAAELAAEEEGVALYHVEVKPDGDGPLGVARVRFLDVASGEMVEREWEIAYEGEAVPLSEADPRMKLAGVAGLTAEKLARSAVGQRVEWDDLLETVRPLKGAFATEARVKELEWMIEKAKELE